MDPREMAPHWEANAATWTAHTRAGYDGYRDLVNTPGFLALLADVTVDEATTAAEPYVVDSLVAPLFLHLCGRKP